MRKPTPSDVRIQLQLDALLAQYAEAVDATDLSPASKAHYIDFAGCFVRWIRGDFEPGKVKGQSRPPTWNRRKNMQPKLPVPEAPER